MLITKHTTMQIAGTIIIIITCLYHVLLRSQAQAALLSKSTGCKGTYSLMRLPTHNRDTQLVPDAMHTITDVVEKLLYLIIGN